MATTILSATRSQTPQYTLPESTRLALISPTAARRHKRAQLIEKQRSAFIARHGDEFGGSVFAGQTH